MLISQGKLALALHSRGWIDFPQTCHSKYIGLLTSKQDLQSQMSLQSQVLHREINNTCILPLHTWNVYVCACESVCVCVEELTAPWHVPSLSIFSTVISKYECQFVLNRSPSLTHSIFFSVSWHKYVSCLCVYEHSFKATWNSYIPAKIV